MCVVKGTKQTKRTAAYINFLIVIYNQAMSVSNPHHWLHIIRMNLTREGFPLSLIFFFLGLQEEKQKLNSLNVVWQNCILSHHDEKLANPLDSSCDPIERS